jgi:hypothetical protein
MERPEARHLRQRRRQRRPARASDLVVCEPRKPRCRSDPKRPTEQHPTARPHGKAHGASCRPTTDARAPTTGKPKRARVAVRPRSSAVRRRICGSAAASADPPESPIWLSASRASLTAAPTLKRPATPHPTARPRTPKHKARAAAQPPMQEPQRQERPNAHAWPCTPEIERREARHLRQRRRQRSHARDSDLVACEPRKPRCRSDPKTPRRPTSDRGPARRSTWRELPPNHPCASPNYRKPQRARVAVPPRSSVVRRRISGSAANSAVVPEAPIWLPASRASLTAAPARKARRPTSDRAPARRSTHRELPPNHRCASMCVHSFVCVRVRLSV